MTWALFVLGAVVSWGIYGVLLYQGQLHLGNPLRALLCVGFAYFVTAVIVPIAGLSYLSQHSPQGALGGFNAAGSILATAAGTLGAVGAICIIWAFRAGGLPIYVMPLVFAGAPLVNVLTSVVLHPPRTTPHPMLYVGFVLAAAGAGMVLYFRPQ